MSRVAVVSPFSRPAEAEAALRRDLERRLRRQHPSPRRAAREDRRIANRRSKVKGSLRAGARPAPGQATDRRRRRRCCSVIPPHTP